MSAFEQEIRQFIGENFLFGEEDCKLSNDDSLLENGVIDSTGVLELVSFLEEKYRFKINDNELVPANLDSISGLIQFIDRKALATN